MQSTKKEEGKKRAKGKARCSRCFGRWRVCKTGSYITQSDVTAGFTVIQQLSGSHSNWSFGNHSTNENSGTITQTVFDFELLQRQARWRLVGPVLLFCFFFFSIVFFNTKLWTTQKSFLAVQNTRLQPEQPTADARTAHLSCARTWCSGFDWQLQLPWYCCLTLPSLTVKQWALLRNRLGRRGRGGRFLLIYFRETGEDQQMHKHNKHFVGRRSVVADHTEGETGSYATQSCVTKEFMHEGTFFFCFVFFTK